MLDSLTIPRVIESALLELNRPDHRSPHGHKADSIPIVCCATGLKSAVRDIQQNAVVVVQQRAHWSTQLTFLPERDFARRPRPARTYFDWKFNFFAVFFFDFCSFTSLVLKVAYGTVRCCPFDDRYPVEGAHYTNYSWYAPPWQTVRQQITFKTATLAVFVHCISPACFTDANVNVNVEN